jgi:hypothetical protein
MITKTVKIYDGPTIPEDQFAIVEHPRPKLLHIKRIDDKDLETTYLDVLGRQLTYVDIYKYPLLPGSHTIEAFIDGYVRFPAGGSARYKGNLLYVTFNVEAGEVYVLAYEMSGSSLFGSWDLLIKDKTSGLVIATASDTRISELTQDLTNDSVDVRMNAVEILSEDGSSKVVKPLIIALEDKEYKVRMIAISALIDIGDTTAIIPLKKLDQRVSGEEKILTSSALVIFGDKDVDPELIFKGLSNKEFLVRAASAFALGHLEDKSTVESLIGIVNDEAPKVRKSVAWSLGELGYNIAIEPLKKLCEDEDSNVRETAKEALKKLK